MRLFIFASLLLCGCPDPSSPADGTTDGAGGGQGAGPGGGGGGGGGAQPPPMGMAKFDVAPGEGVKLSGTIAYSGTKTGAVHVDFLRAPENSSYPELLHSISIEALGPWEVEAPKGTGKVGIVAYVDIAGDGPNDGDPAARVPGLVDVGQEAILGLDVTLSDTPDLGEFTPGKGDGGGPAPGAGGPGAGGPPGEAPPSGDAAPPGEGAPGGGPKGEAPPAGEAPAAPPAGEVAPK